MVPRLVGMASSSHRVILDREQRSVGIVCRDARLGLIHPDWVGVKK